MGLPRWLSGKNIHLPVQEMWVCSLGQEDPWRRKWQPSPVFSSGKTHGQRSLVGYDPWDRKRVGYDRGTKEQQQAFIAPVGTL